MNEILGFLRRFSYQNVDCVKLTSKYKQGNVQLRRSLGNYYRVFYISLVFSNACRVLSQCNTRLRLLYLLNTSSNQRL